MPLGMDMCMCTCVCGWVGVLDVGACVHVC